MAELCEVCWKPLKHWIDTPNYKEDVCSECSEKLDNKFDGDVTKVEKFIEKLKTKNSNLLPLKNFENVCLSR